MNYLWENCQANYQMVWEGEMIGEESFDFFFVVVIYNNSFRKQKSHGPPFRTRKKKRFTVIKENSRFKETMKINNIKSSTQSRNLHLQKMISQLNLEWLFKKTFIVFFTQRLNGGKAISSWVDKSHSLSVKWEGFQNFRN